MSERERGREAEAEQQDIGEWEREGFSSLERMKGKRTHESLKGLGYREKRGSWNKLYAIWSKLFLLGVTTLSRASGSRGKRVRESLLKSDALGFFR